MAEGKRAERRKGKKETWFSRLTRTQKWLVLAAIVLAVALVLVVAYRGLFVKPDLGGKRGEGKDEPIEYGEGVRPKADGTRKSEDYYTVLILGRDTGGGGNTDTMLLASYDVTNQKATVMSIPRDTMVNVSWDVKKINSVYNVYGGGEKGIRAVYREIAQLVGFEPDYQVVVEWEAVGAIVDAIGGVYFDVPYNMDYHDPDQDLVIEQAKGYRLLSGEDAMQVIRWRKNDRYSPYGKTAVGDSGRMEIQQAFLKAVIEQMMQPKNVLNIGKISKVFEENVETDLSFQNILWFGKQAFSGGLSTEDVAFLTMPWKGASAYSRTYSRQLGRNFYLDYVVPIPSELLAIVNEQLSPFEEPFTLSDLDVMFVNADGSLGSTSGRVEDTAAAAPPQKSDAGAPDVTGTVDEDGEIVDPETGEVIEAEAPPTGPTDGDGGETAGETSTPTEPTETQTPDEPENEFIIIQPPPDAA